MSITTANIEQQRNSRSMLAVHLGLTANVFLAVIKTVIGVIGHSPALLADGVNSTSDVAYNLVVATFVRLAGKPADHEHPFGHRQFESIAALTVGAFVITTAITIFWDSVNAIFDHFSGQEVLQAASISALWAALATIALKTLLFIYTDRIGKQTNNPAVIAVAYDHRNDILSAGAALVGIMLARAGYAWVDPLAGALVALVVLRTGIFILRQSADELMDSVPGKELEKQIVEALKSVAGICRIDEIHAHRFGPNFVVNLTICVSGQLSVREGDHIASNAEETLIRSIPNLQVVHVHYHPEECAQRAQG